MKDFTELRQELREFYAGLDYIARDFNESCSAELEKRISEDMSAYEQKRIQYETIAEMCSPVLFHSSVFYYEAATMSPCTQGEGEDSRSKLAPWHPGGWLYRHNKHKFREADPVLFDNSRVPFYSWCGEYGDFRYHFVFNMKPVFEGGLRSLYEKAEKALREPCTPEERDYLENTLLGLKTLKRVSEKFAVLAEEMLKTVSDPEEQKRLSIIAETARRVPWEPPQNFREALNALAFLMKVVGALEGLNLTDFGRLDVNLYPFYERDLREGTFTKDEIYDLIREFLLVWYLHADHETPRDGTSSNESYVLTLGGCDRDGKPVYNELTRLFLAAHREEKLITPKLCCRYSANSPKEYLDSVNGEILRGRTTMLYLNDSGLIPAFEKLGIPTEDARDYSILGCWEPVLPDCTNEHCGYVSLIKIFEYSVYGDWEHADLPIVPLENARSFEEVYDITLGNLERVLRHKSNAAYHGRQVWPKVDPLMLMSSALDSCIETKRDYTAGGAKYKIDELVCTGIVNVVNSLLVIRELCFEKKLVSLKALLDAVRKNWAGNEELRQTALASPYWGDEQDVSSCMMGRLTHDLWRVTKDYPVLYGGKISLGYMLYLELYGWAKLLRATPDGRHDGDFFERGLTPSILHPVESVTAVVNSMRAIDPSEIGADSVLNLTLSLKPEDTDAFASFLRAASETGMQALQANCVTREELLEARCDPTKHRDIVVRVCGYSARFVSLPDMIQDEFLQRNFIAK